MAPRRLIDEDGMHTEFTVHVYTRPKLVGLCEKRETSFKVTLHPQTFRVRHLQRGQNFPKLRLYDRMFEPLCMLVILSSS